MITFLSLQPSAWGVPLEKIASLLMEVKQDMTPLKIQKNSYWV